MKERPILFSGPMVRAILDGRKTQTRRVVKPQPNYLPEYPPRYDEKSGCAEWASPRGDNFKECPYGATGNRLWVRENGWERPFRTRHMMREGADTWEKYYYDADGLTRADHEQFKKWGFKRRPSIHMPRWASRITLEIVKVRVERLQEISSDDSIAEGIEPSDVGTADGADGARLEAAFNISAYATLWDKINGAGVLDENPWVWVVEFKRLVGEASA